MEEKPNVEEVIKQDTLEGTRPTTVQRSLTWTNPAPITPTPVQKEEEAKQHSTFERHRQSKHSSRSVDSYASNDRIILLQRKATVNTAEEKSKRSIRTLTLGADSERIRHTPPLLKRITFGTEGRMSLLAKGGKSSVGEFTF